MLRLRHRLLGAFFAFILAFVLSACGDDAGNGAGGRPKPDAAGATVTTADSDLGTILVAKTTAVTDQAHRQLRARTQPRPRSSSVSRASSGSPSPFAVSHFRAPPWRRSSWSRNAAMVSARGVCASTGTRSMSSA